jgi:hypothetical protein
MTGSAVFGTATVTCGELRGWEVVTLAGANELKGDAALD